MHKVEGRIWAHNEQEGEMSFFSFSIILIVIGGTLGIVYLYNCFAYMHDPDAKKPNWIRKLHGEELDGVVQIIENWNASVKKRLQVYKNSGGRLIFLFEFSVWFLFRF